jgi:ketosteroid isomerase-like protein
MSAESDIRKASDKFYAALNSILNGDWTPMADVWSRSPDVSTMHPPGGTEVGWDEIRASWENLAKICSNGRVELRDQRISIGEDLAYETGTEHVNVLIAKAKAQADLRVSNVFRREGSEWKMVRSLSRRRSGGERINRPNTPFHYQIIISEINATLH